MEISREYSPIIREVTDRLEELNGIASWGGFSLPDGAADHLATLESWIVEEAIPAGGVGPNEAERLWERHIIDSALFGGFVEPGASVLDVGSGVGLPGLVVAVIRPDCQLTLLDRSGRRCNLARRATRILGLHNVEVVQGAVPGYEGDHDVALARASLPPDRLVDALQGIQKLRSVVAAGSRTEPPAAPDGWGTVEIPVDVVGERVWMLRAWLSADEAG